MDDREGSFVAVRGISQGLERGTVYTSSSHSLHSTEECLQNRIDVAYDTTIPLHQVHISRQVSFRGGGFISLENLLYFARNFQKSFQDLLRKQVGERSVWEYPFAVAGINLTFMLIQMLDLEATIRGLLTILSLKLFTVKPRTVTFLKFLSAENESAFDILYCIAFKLMDQQWLSMHIHGIQHGDEINKETAGERADAGRYNAS
ncbi:unnamed protein product [Brassica napus]|uniref:(rape) hypothetical protein n=1 Tax=Brassica napus TaxID=3708 RepID=A0A816I1K1_BRANA|nr:unnamed protein product [Brassica napus]